MPDSDLVMEDEVGDKALEARVPDLGSLQYYFLKSGMEGYLDLQSGEVVKVARARGVL